ncbi:MAG: hypothetical protein IJK67_04495 [Bacilli bacterium]|nr:hypothetical protein [Bacilli bacterium]
MKKEIYKVNPIVIYPKCIIENGVQSDCHVCPERNICASPRSMCIRPYPGHKDGCPNYGKLPTCPPDIPSMYDQIFDTSNVYAVVTKFNLKEYFDKRRANRPDLPEGQITNIRNWQPIAIKENDYAICEFYKENPNLSDYVSTRLLECMGVHVIDTMKEVGIELKFPVKDYAYRVAFAAKTNEGALEEYGFDIYEPQDKHKKGMKMLIRKKQD